VVPPRHPVRIALVILVCALCVVVAAARPERAGAISKSEVRLLNVLNNTRAAHGLRRVRLGSAIQSGAHRWARYLLRHDTFYHARLSYGTSENIGWLTCRRGWARALVRMWLNSYSHRVHLLDRSVRRVGVGVSRGSWSGWSCVRMAVTRFR
jgi:uncharacterized protein YkwD